MRDEYDFSKGEKNPYAKSKKQKQQITINIDKETVEYGKDQASVTGVTYQTLINLYLSDCVVNEKQFEYKWK